MIIVTNLNPFETSLEELANTVFSSKKNSNLYELKKTGDDTSTITYSTKFNNLDVSIDVFSTCYLTGYKFTLTEDNNIIGSVRVDQGDPNENWSGEKTLFYSLANVNIDNNETVKKDFTDIYLKDAVQHMQKELNEKLTPLIPSDYQKVLNNMKKLKEAKKENQLTPSTKNRI